MRISLLAAALVLLVSGCPDKPSTDNSKSVFEPAPTAPAGEAGAANPHAGMDPGALPAGHPPMGGAMGGAAAGNPQMVGGIAAPSAAAGQGAMALTWTLPEGWKETPPANAMRRAQFEVEGKGGKAECVVFYFGPGQGGDPLSNARRWADQFQQPDGKPSSEVMKTGSRKAGEIEITTVEVTGTYANTMMGGAPEANQMLLGAVAMGPDAPWFFKFTGPQETVEGARAGFEALLDSLKAGAAAAEKAAE
ncbi:MAG: hypothetical protein P1V51_15495 [Deltaproteobacteria bacterium]|nr:hypothetical protein [Deltaproteobacteria bacterium]